MCPAIVSGIVIGDAPVSFWPIVFPIASCSPRSLCETQLGPVSFSFLKRRNRWPVLSQTHASLFGFLPAQVQSQRQPEINKDSKIINHSYFYGVHGKRKILSILWTAKSSCLDHYHISHMVSEWKGRLRVSGETDLITDYKTVGSFLNRFSVASVSHVRRARASHALRVPSLAISFQPRYRPFVWMFARIWIKYGLLCSLKGTSLIRSTHIVPFLESSVPIDFQELNVLQLTVLAVKKEPNKRYPKKLLTKLLFNTVIPRSGLGKPHPASNTEENI